MTTTTRGDALDALALARAYVTGDQEGLATVWEHSDRAAVLAAALSLWTGHLIATTGSVDEAADLLGRLSLGLVNGQEDHT